jgi:protein-S-isoprenylcysteine O-methyltransferase Ste14
MKTQRMTMILAPLGVAIGITLITTATNRLFTWFGINELHDMTNYIGMPLWVVRLVGLMNVITFTAFFIAGFITLGPKGASGNSQVLRTTHAYKYVRNPMYAGVSFTLSGIGLLFGITGLAVTGLLWLCICYIVVRGEENNLEKRFKNEYFEYKNSTSRFVPDFSLLAADIFHSKKIYEKRKLKTKKVSIFSNKK